MFNFEHEFQGNAVYLIRKAKLSIKRISSWGCAVRAVLGSLFGTFGFVGLAGRVPRFFISII